MVMLANKQAEFDVYARESELANSASAAKDTGDDSSEWNDLLASTPELQQITSKLIEAERARQGLNGNDKQEDELSEQ